MTGDYANVAAKAEAAISSASSPDAGRAAADKLLRDSLAAAGGNNQQASNEAKALGESLDKNGLLTEMAAYWFSQHRHEYDENNDGTLDIDEIRKGVEKAEIADMKCQIKTEKIGNPSCRDGEYSKIMLGALEKNFDTVRSAHMDDASRWYHKVGHNGAMIRIDRDAITHYDVQDFLAQKDAARAMTPLLNETFFKTLDDAENHDNKFDNKIDKDDLKAFVHRYDALTENGAKRIDECGAFTKSNRDFAQKLIDTWQDGLGKILRDGRDEISLESLKKLAGCKDANNISELAQKVAAMRATEKTVTEQKAVTEQKNEQKIATEQKNEQKIATEQKNEQKTVTEQKNEQKTVTEQKNEQRIVTEQKSEVQKLHAELIKLSSVRAGEGPYQVAERLLGSGAKTDEILALTNILKENYIKEHCNDANSLKSLRVGYSFLTQENVAQIVEKVPALKTRHEQRSSSRVAISSRGNACLPK